MEESIILLKQTPVFISKIEDAGKEVKEAIASLNLDSMVATSDTIQSLKDTRSELNKKSKRYAEEFKTAISPVTTTVKEVTDKFKEEIKVEFDKADKVLKTTITNFELSLKEEIQKEIQLFFDEYAVSVEIYFVKFTDAKININLSTSKKKYREQCVEFIDRVKSDIDLIATENYSAEMMAEYKSNGYNSSYAITTVRKRKEAERSEKEREATARYNKRCYSLTKMAFIRHDVPAILCFVSDESIYVDDSDIRNLSDKEWVKKYSEIEYKVNEYHKSNKSNEEAKEEVKQVISKPLSTPKVETKVDEYERVAEFKVTATIDKLKLLAAFLKENNIKYETL